MFGFDADVDVEVGGFEGLALGGVDDLRLAVSTTLLEADSDLRIPADTVIAHATYQPHQITTILPDDQPTQVSP